MMYKFYVKMDGETFGPYSAKEVRDLQLLDDIMVTEESMSEWLPACNFDFDDMVRKEFASMINEDGSINRGQDISTPSSSVQPIQATQPAQTQRISANREDVPYEIKKWNWGAFCFNWLWGVCNGVYWPLLLIIVNFIPYVGGLISLGACIALGINGNEWAWKAKTWSSIAEFKRVQHNWSIAILWVFGISIAIGIMAGLAG